MLVRRFAVWSSVIVLVLLALQSVLVGAPPDARRSSRLFEIDSKGRRILGPAAHVPGFLGLKLSSVTVDQPEFWPSDAVHLKILAPTRPGASVIVEWQKRDATPTKLPPTTLDAGGVAVVTLMDGEKRPIELGEYRAVVHGEGATTLGEATFAVVEGALGSLSFAYEFKQVTTIEALDASRGGWFLGNAEGAGKRWGNGLSFRNELRLDNRPFTGDVELASRCMLSGCNGVDAGPRQTVHVEKGLIEATLDVGGHSGPFQLEVIAAGGSLRYQFEGSSHVERDMVSVAMGMGYDHRAGLAPYEGTTQVPGRSIWVERGDAHPDDAFEVSSAIAAGGKLSISIRKAITGAAVIVWSPSVIGTKTPGAYTPERVEKVGDLAAGATVDVAISAPFSLVTVGGFVKGELVEGFVVAFAPSRVGVALALPAAGGPLSTISIGVLTQDGEGRGVATSGILEVYDNRVASRSPLTPLTSAIGDSVRNVSNSLTAWVDPIEAEKARVRYEEELKKARDMAPHGGGESMAAEKDEAISPMAPPPSVMPSAIMAPSVAGSIRASNGPSGPPGALSVSADQGDEGEVVRKGEKKVVACVAVRTGPDGRATIDVKLPPQTGRVTVRFVAVSGYDHRAAQESVDVTKRAFADLKVPNVFVPGTALTARLPISNNTSEAVTVQVSGAGITTVISEKIEPGQHELVVPWDGDKAGTLTVVLTAADGKVVDRREVAVRDLAKQPVTYSRLAMGGAPIAVKAGETAVAFEGPGQLMRGIVMNVVTTMYSWFGHAEALSAGVAVRATLLTAIRRGVLADEGLGQTLAVDLDKAARDLETVFFDASTGLVRPWPGLPPSPLWSAWVARNLHAADRVLGSDKAVATEFAPVRARCQTLAAAIDTALAKGKFGPDALGGYQADGPDAGLETVPVEVDGKVVWKVVTDSVVAEFVAGKLLPTLDDDARTGELAFARAFDTFRFLRAFERTGLLQYLSETARGLWLAGPSKRAEFDRLFAVITRGMIFAQEPGMIQGPALLGGVYSSPMALVRFLDLVMLTLDGKAASGGVAVAGGETKSAAYGEKITGGALTVTAPVGAVIRIDTPGEVVLTDLPKPPFATVALTSTRLAVGEEGGLTIELAADKDPLEYVAIVAVPTTTAIKQTEDILSDYKGQLIYGQQGTGASKLQVLAVPFRGSRTMRLWIEGLYVGSAPGFVAIRHLSNPGDACTVPVPKVTVAP